MSFVSVRAEFWLYKIAVFLSKGELNPALCGFELDHDASSECPNFITSLIGSKPET